MRHVLRIVKISITGGRPLLTLQEVDHLLICLIPYRYATLWWVVILRCLTSIDRYDNYLQFTWDYSLSSVSFPMCDMLRWICCKTFLILIYIFFVLSPTVPDPYPPPQLMFHRVLLKNNPQLTILTRPVD